jgi:ATP synthase protein I
MSASTGQSKRQNRGPNEEEAQMRALGLGTGWTVFSYMISGLVAYGAIGWGIGKAVHAEWPLPAGMIVGLAISVGFIIYRYGRQGLLEQPDAGPGRVKGNDR